MNVTLTSLEALILKATHESLPCPDAAALEAFCAVMRDSADGPQYAVQALAARIHALNAREALLALTMIDRCMRRCDANFHAEVGKFRFLNEMIKLVSPKYCADRTAPEVRTRVLQLLHAWSIEFPKETKFKVAYDMLKNQGVVKETPPPLPPEDSPPAPRVRAKSAIFEDEEKSKLLQKLLQSKKPEDLQHANRLIKTMVREEERRSEASSRRAQEVSAALDSAGLLRDMLLRARDASPDEEQLIHELHASCSRLRPVLFRLATAESQTDNLNDILNASELLDEVFKKYNIFVNEKKGKAKSTEGIAENNNDSLLDFAGANARNVGQEDLKPESKGNVIDELRDIFSTETGAGNIVEPLTPVNLMPSEDADLLGERKNSKAEGWNELDSLGEQLLKQSLPENAKVIDGFNSKSTKKIPMNALEKLSPKHDAQLLASNGSLFDLDYLIKKPEEKLLTPPPKSPKSVIPNDDVMVDISTETPNASAHMNNNNGNSPLDNLLGLGLNLDNSTKCDKTENTIGNMGVKCAEEKRDNLKNELEVKPLTDINVTLQSVQPSNVPPLTAYEEPTGLTVVLHFCKDKPRPDVNVIVISTTSKNPLPIKDYKFQGTVPKDCKIRLLTPSGTYLPAYSPFLPPPALTQVLLVGRPPPAPALAPGPTAATPLCLKFVITYTCDGETCFEMDEVKIPLDDIK